MKPLTPARTGNVISAKGGKVHLMSPMSRNDADRVITPNCASYGIIQRNTGRMTTYALTDAPVTCRRCLPTVKAAPAPVDVATREADAALTIVGVTRTDDGYTVHYADGSEASQATPPAGWEFEPVPAPLPAETTAGRAAQLNLASDYRRFLTGRGDTPALALALAHAHATLGQPGAMADLTDEQSDFTYDLPFNVYGEAATRNVRATPYNGDIMITDTVNGVTRELCSVARYMTGQLARRAIVVLRERVRKAQTTIHYGTTRESCASHGCAGCGQEATPTTATTPASDPSGAIASRIRTEYAVAAQNAAGAMNNPAYLMNATVAPAPMPPLETPTGPRGWNSTATPEPVPPLEIPTGPTRTITDRDMLIQVRRATDASDGVFDNIAIVDEIKAAYGLVDIDTLDHDAFWTIVARYELGAMPMPADHIIPMVEADVSQRRYGMSHRSEYVYRTSRSSYPTRIEVWDNTLRLNPRNGQPVKWGEVGPIDGGNGKYLDPQNRATDQPVSVLVSPECIALDAYGTSTGTAGSGQVYAPGETLRKGETVTLAYPDGMESGPHAVRFTNNGHGFIEI